jgi:hypothetical protein
MMTVVMVMMMVVVMVLMMIMMIMMIMIMMMEMVMRAIARDVRPDMGPQRAMSGCSWCQGREQSIEMLPPGYATSCAGLTPLKRLESMPICKQPQSHAEKACENILNPMLKRACEKNPQSPAEKSM